MSLRRSDFKIGCIVQLKSGGADMVVGKMPKPTIIVDYEDDEKLDPDMVYCQWHDSYLRQHAQSYHFRELIIISD